MTVKESRYITETLAYFEYAPIEWPMSSIPIYLLRNDAIDLFNMNELLMAINRPTPRDIAVANLIIELANL